jgi:transcriptional regulator with XRE-family HTH domain
MDTNVIDMNTNEERMNSSLGMQIKIELAERGMSQGDLADAVGVGRVAINKYIKGRVSPTMETFAKMAGALGLSPAVLMDRVVARAAKED